MADVETVQSPSVENSMTTENSTDNDAHSRELSSDNIPLDENQDNIDDSNVMNGNSHDRTASSNTLAESLDSGLEASAEAPTKELTGDAKPATKPKAPVTVDAKARKTAPPPVKPGTKAASGTVAPTPTVKKVLNSGTFGVGSARPSAVGTKPTATKPATASTTGAASRRTLSTASTSSVKPAASTTSATTRSPTATSPTGTTKSTAAAKPATTTAKPAATATRTAAGATTAPAAARRTSVLPPASSTSTTAATARPRASVAPTTTTTTRTAGLRASVAPSSSTTAKAPAKPGASMSRSTPTITETKEDSKANEEIQQKLQQALADVAAKTEQIQDVEAQLAELRASLEQNASEANDRTTELGALKAALEESKGIREKLELDIQELKDTSGKLGEERDAEAGKASAELEATRKSLADAEETAEKLSHDLVAVQTELAHANDAIKAHNDAKDQLEGSAAVEHEALLKAKADLEAIRIETQALTDAHNLALGQSAARIAELEAEVSNLQADAKALKETLQRLEKEKEEASAQLTEASVEVLELKEALERTESDSSKVSADLKAKHATELQELREELEAKVGEAVEANNEAAAKWEEATKAAKEVHSVELEGAVKSAQELAQKAGEEALNALREEHEKKVKELEELSLRKLEEVGKDYEEKVNDLTAQVKALSVELERQEEHYTVKLDGVKAEHATLLEKAFNDAKTEAGTAHAQDLSTLRAQSQATIDQIRDMHKTELTDLKSSHTTNLEEEIKSREKKIAGLTLELTATQDDLAKAKASTSVAQRVQASLKEQIETMKREAAEQSAAGDEASALEIQRLSKELAVALEDVDHLKTTFEESHRTLSQQHTRELEEAAKGRIQALEALKQGHEAELARLNGVKAELLSELEDTRDQRDKAQSELATAARAVSTPTKVNGAPPAGVSREELEKLHRAHNLKLEEMEGSHAKEIEALREEMAKLRQEKDDTLANLSRKEMELGFLEQERDEALDDSSRLQEELAALNAAMTAH